MRPCVAALLPGWLRTHTHPAPLAARRRHRGAWRPAGACEPRPDGRHAFHGRGSRRGGWHQRRHRHHARAWHHRHPGPAVQRCRERRRPRGHRQCRLGGGAAAVWVPRYTGCSLLVSTSLLHVPPWPAYATVAARHWPKHACMHGRQARAFAWGGAAAAFLTFAAGRVAVCAAWHECKGCMHMPACRLLPVRGSIWARLLPRCVALRAWQAHAWRQGVPVLARHASWWPHQAQQALGHCTSTSDLGQACWACDRYLLLSQKLMVRTEPPRMYGALLQQAWHVWLGLQVLAGLACLVEHWSTPITVAAAALDKQYRC